MAENHNETKGLVKGLNIFSATALVVGSSIGSGIFITPSIMAGYIESPGIIIFLFLLGGIFTLCGALSYGEMSASMPGSGGQYVFLREAFSPFLGFLYGWSLFLVIQTGLIAAVAVAFAKYLGVFLPFISEKEIIFTLGGFSLNTAQIVGIISIIVLTGINCLGVKLGGLVQNIFTFLKVFAIILLVVLGFILVKGDWNNFNPLLNPLVPATAGMGLTAAFTVAFSKALFTYDGWNTVTFTAEEVENPQKTLPLALILGTGIITIVYAIATAVYFYIIPVSEANAVPDNRIAAAVAQIIFGPAGLFLIAGSILISTFGCNNGLILGGARVYYAMAKDGMFFKKLGEVDLKHHVPLNALIIQGIWSCFLTLTGSYSDLLTYTTCMAVVFNVLTVAGLFILRNKNPHMHRPYKTWGYPFTPLLFLLIGSAFMIYIFQGDPVNSFKGLGLVLLGIPVFFVFNRKSKEAGNKT